MQKLISSILDCASDPTRWEDAMDGFAQTFAVKSAILYSVNSQFDIAPSAYASAFLRVGEGARTMRAFERGEITGDESLFERVFQMPPGQFRSECQVFGVNSLDQLPPSEIRERTTDLGIYSRSGALLNHTGPWVDILSLHAGNRDQEDAMLADDRMHIVLKIMERSIELQRIFDTLRARYRAALSVLDNLGLGIVLVTDKGEIILSNTEAQRIFDLCDGIHIGRDNRLSCDDPEYSAQLQALASAAGAAAAIPSAPAILTIPRPSGHFDFVVSTGAIHDSLAELDPGLNCGVIVVIDPLRPIPLDVRGAAALGKLTPAETEIASALVAGLSASEIATSRDTSLHTIRTQLKTLSAKLRCNSQADIIRLAAATRLPLNEAPAKK